MCEIAYARFWIITVLDVDQYDSKESWKGHSEFVSTDKDLQCDC